LKLFKRIRSWRHLRRIKREHRYLEKETQRIVRLYGPLDSEGETSLQYSRISGIRHGLKLAFTFGLWFVYRKVLRARRPLIDEEAINEIAQALKASRQAQESKNIKKAAKSLEALDKKVGYHLGFARKSTIREYVESIGVAVLIALFLRAFVVEAFKIPSGSMIPTLEVGDHIFVNKFSYGLRIPLTTDPPRRFFNWGKPKRGEVIVFINRHHVEHDFIKRVIAVGGDEVKVKGSTIYLRRQGRGSWEAIKKTRMEGECRYQDFEAGSWMEQSNCDYYTEYLEGHEYTIIIDRDRENQNYPPLELFKDTSLPIGSLRIRSDKIFNPYKVPEGTVFVMGDNRTNSGDSRLLIKVGFVPENYIKGKSLVVWSSWGPSRSWWGLRWNRIGRVID